MRQALGARVYPQRWQDRWGGAVETQRVRMLQVQFTQEAPSERACGCIRERVGAGGAGGGMEEGCGGGNVNGGEEVMEEVLRAHRQAE